MTGVWMMKLASHYVYSREALTDGGLQEEISQLQLREESVVVLLPGHIQQVQQIQPHQQHHV